MAVLKSASIEDLKRLLGLFPIAKLRENWSGIKGRKQELSHAVAKQAHRDELTRFVDENFSCCKQHVYVFSHPKQLKQLPEIAISDAERVLDVKGKHALYLIKMRYGVVLKDPIEEASLEFLWPFRLDLIRGHLAVRFVVLEKNIATYFGGRSSYISSRSVEEKSVLQEVAASFNGELERADLHEGVKKLWEGGFMDATRTRYKKPISTASEAMDEEIGIKENNPELYKILMKSVLFSTLFQIPPEKGCSVSAFSVDPSNGAFVFPRYSDNMGDTDRVVDEILRNN
jgi:hypothetical protein